MAKPTKVNVYLVLDAKRQIPPHYEAPASLGPLQAIGTYVERPAGAPKGALIHSVSDGPITDIYTCHYVAQAEVEYPGGERQLVFEPEAQRMFELLSYGLNAAELGKQLVENTLSKVSEVVANESQASALAWVADQRRKVARHT